MYARTEDLQVENDLMQLINGTKFVLSNVMQVQAQVAISKI